MCGLPFFRGKTPNRCTRACYRVSASPESTYMSFSTEILFEILFLLLRFINLIYDAI